ncbi:uncharacterized protein IL334_006569 [Kwoniella shivajii]|uniref:Uncharacterized protein n=1 Tax=Kwoniella shivajii TaxID=564305 RepID=A0ABZ1D6A6_9TREE|nr:hypothetical protein IL334_006569 [Kwoniella shivajii]
MEDLSSISSSLQDILSSPEGGESLASTIQTYLSSSSLATQKAVVEVFIELLDEGDDLTRTARRETILSDTSLTYLPLLLPLPFAKEAVLLVAEYAKPREVVLGLIEGIQSILDRSEGYQVSDNDGEEDGDEGYNVDIDWVELIGEYILIIRCLITAIPRLTNNKSTPTLLSINEAISSSLPIIAQETVSSSSKVLLKVLCELVDTTWKWTQETSDKGGEQRAILSNLLFQSITLLGHKANAMMVERWFLKTFPKFKMTRSYHEVAGTGAEEWTDGQEVFNKALESASLLHLTASDLLQNIVNPSHLTAYAALASLNLLSSRLVTESPTSLIPTAVSSTLIDDSMPILFAALSGSSIDAGLTYTWTLVHYALQNEQKTGEKIMEYDNASMLIELLVPLTAQHPSSLTRLALFKLIGGIVSIQQSVTNKIDLFKQLLEPANPFDNIRIQTLSLLRELISNKQVLSPVLVDVIFPILFIPSNSQTQNDDPFSLPPSELLKSPYITWWTECLNLFWLLVDLDHDDVTSVVAYAQGNEGLNRWIDAIGQKSLDIQAHLRTEENGPDGAEFTVMRLEDALSRAKESPIN